MPCEGRASAMGSTKPGRFRTTRGDDRHAIDIRPSRLNGEIDFLLLKIAEALGDDFPELVSAGDPAELHVDGL